MDTEHEFDDRAYVREWADSADRRRPQRAPMFQRIVELLRGLANPAPRVVELGCGPGTLAEAVLVHLPHATYEGLDFSRPMLELAQERLARFGGRARLLPCDVNRDDWPGRVSCPVDAVVTNQALHDLGSAEAVAAAYATSLRCLAPGGLFVNAELVADPVRPANKPGKLSVARHLAALREAGFADVRTEADFGDYVALVGRRPA